jgi:hypothetical protein
MRRGIVYGVVIGSACVGVWVTLAVLAEAIRRAPEIAVWGIVGNLLVMVTVVALYELWRRRNDRTL